MGVVNSPESSQQKMNDLFHRFELVHAYVYEFLILTEGNQTYHVQKVELTINKMKVNGLKYNIEKSFFKQTEMKYLGFWVTQYGVKPKNINI